MIFLSITLLLSAFFFRPAAVAKATDTFLWDQVSDQIHVYSAVPHLVVVE
jgi:hypothetical protein